MMSLRCRVTWWLLSLALLLPAVAGAQNGSVAPVPMPVFVDATGAICASCLLYAYESGTETEQDTFQEVTNTTPHTNPIVINAAGRPPAPIFLSANSYKFVLKTSADVEIWSADSIQATHASATAITSLTDISLQVDSNNDGTNTFQFKDGGGTVRMELAETGALQIDHNLTIGDATAADKQINFDGNAQDYHIGLDDSADTLVIGRGTALGTTAAITVATTGVITYGHVVDFGQCQGRLTLTTAVPVTTADVTAATTLYFTPYKGNRCPTYDGTALWIHGTFSEVSIAVPATTATMYDVYLYDNAGTPTLELTAWTNDTTRATALILQNGVYVKTGVTTRRYLGSFRTTGVSGQTEDSLAKRYVWNYYNRVPRLGRVLEATDTWAYSTDSYQQANASAANQLDFVIGVAEVLVHVTVVGTATNSGGIIRVEVAIGEDSATTPTTGNIGLESSASTGARNPVVATLEKSPAVGRHYYTWLEKAAASGTTTWYGDNGNNANGQTGISGWIEG